VGKAAGFIVVFVLSFLTLFAFGGCGDDDGTEPQEATWHTIFEDHFDSQSLNPNWILAEGDASNYQLTGTEIGVDDSDTADDGPLFFYNKIISSNRIRVTCKIRTAAMSGKIEYAIGMRSSYDVDSVYALEVNDDSMAIVKITPGSEDTLAATNLTPMGSFEIRMLYCEYNNGTITFTEKNTVGSVIGSVTAIDSSPLPAGKVGFIGEVQGSQGEYLYFDDFKLEKYE